jgi:4'-phosphopantetheinyl transferase
MTAHATRGTPARRWRTAPADLRLGRSDVHVWLVDLDRAPAGAAASAEATLSPDERARATRFRFEPLRRRFVNGRIAMRGILSRYLGRYKGVGTPAELRFAYGPHGRPALAERRSLHFNFTRSGPLALCAVARTALLGIDLEQIRPIPEAGSITQSHFSKREQELLASLGEAPETLAFQRAFYATWTRKEAFIKALGLGLAQPLDAFSVTLLPGQRPRLLEVPKGRPETWTLRAFSPAPGYEAALAIRALRVRLAFWMWPQQPDAPAR